MAPHHASHADIARLLADLASDEALRRETAAARLALAGRKAVPDLARLAQDPTATVTTRLAALEVIEAIDVARAATVATTLTDAAQDELAIAAVSILARAIDGTGAAAAAALDRVTALALDAGASVARRIAALSALEHLPARVIDPIYDALRADAASRIVARVVRRQAGIDVSLEDIAVDGLPASAGALAAVVRAEAGEARVTVLKTLIDLIRTRERRAGGDRAEWTAIRGQVHQHLAARGSRLALYDLRETLAESRSRRRMAANASAR